MKGFNPRKSLSELCGLFGKTRSAYYQWFQREETESVRRSIILKEVRIIREELPRIGVRKLQKILQENLEPHQIDIGRDYLFELLSNYGMLIRCRKRKMITTNSRHWMRKYKNQIKDLAIDRPNQVWVSDITYLKTSGGWSYLSLITDAYSHKIVGHSLRQDMSAEGCLEALNMAIAQRSGKESLIHHSDRGSQYCSQNYVKVLNKNDIVISMTENSDPYENAVAERVNGIIKNEFNLAYGNLRFDQLKVRVSQCIEAYNQQRPHLSCDYLTPNKAHSQKGMLHKRWKNYYQSKNVNQKNVQSF